MCYLGDYKPDKITTLPWTPREKPVSGLVSVIIPTFNRKDYIIEAVESVVRQTYRPVEIVIVDDGSTDGTDIALREKYGNSEDLRSCRLVIVKQERFGGQRARNRGILEASGEFIQFLDSDDTLAPDKFALHVAHFNANPGLDISVGQTCAMENPARSLHAHREYEFLELMARSVTWSQFSTLGPMVRSRVFKESNRVWDERMQKNHDDEFFVRLLLLGHTYGYCLAARAFIRPEDNRVRFGTQCVAERDHTFWRSRAIQLGSMWYYLPESLRNDSRFRHEMALALLLVCDALYRHGDREIALRSLQWAQNIVANTIWSSAGKLLSALARRKLAIPGFLVFRLHVFVYYRLTGIRDRLAKMGR